MIFLIAFGVENKTKLGKCVLPGTLAWNGGGGGGGGSPENTRFSIKHRM